MTDVPETTRLLIAARQWLEVLIAETGVDPDQTVMEAVAVSPEGRRVVATVKLADTLAEIDATGITVQQWPDNDPD